MSAEVIIAIASAVGLATGGLIIWVRATDQRHRDARRTVVTIRFPRGVTDKQVMAVIRVLIGIPPTKSGLVGTDSLVFEVVGTHNAISFRVRLPESLSRYFQAQIRAAIQGVAIEDIDDPKDARLGIVAGLELRRRVTAADLLVEPAADVSRTIVTAVSELRRHETAVWSVVITGGVSPRPTPGLGWRQAIGLIAVEREPKPLASGVQRLAIRLGAKAGTPKRTDELLARLRRAAASTSSAGARLVPRLRTKRYVARLIERGATPVLAAAILARPEETRGLLGWPIDSPVVANLTLGGSPQLPVSPVVPRTGRPLGMGLLPKRPVAQAVRSARTHMLIAGPTGAGKTYLSARTVLDDIEHYRGGAVVDPKGGLIKALLERAPEDAIGRIIVVDPTDEERPVPLPLLAPGGAIDSELSVDTVVGLLRHTFGDLGPRSSDILGASLYSLARMPEPVFSDLFRLWTDIGFRAEVVGRAADDPILATFWAWFDGLGPAERNFVLAAPTNKIRPLLIRSVVRNVISAPRATFTMAEAMRDKLTVLVHLPEGQLGESATTLLGGVAIAQTWVAAQGRLGRTPFNLTIDEAPRFLGAATDLGDVLARAREYGVGTTLLTQSLGMFPPPLRDIALNSSRTKIAFGTASADAKRLAAEFGPTVLPEYFAGLGEYEAIGQVAIGSTVSPPFSFVTEDLGPVIPGRAKAIRAASRERWGVPREELEARWKRDNSGPGTPPGPIGRRPNQ